MKRLKADSPEEAQVLGLHRAIDGASHVAGALVVLVGSAMLESDEDIVLKAKLCILLNAAHKQLEAARSLLHSSFLLESEDDPTRDIRVVPDKPFG
jgi:hypothetical protein